MSSQIMYKHVASLGLFPWPELVQDPNTIPEPRNGAFPEYRGLQDVVSVTRLPSLVEALAKSAILTNTALSSGPSHLAHSKISGHRVFTSGIYLREKDQTELTDPAIAKLPYGSISNKNQGFIVRASFNIISPDPLCGHHSDSPQIPTLSTENPMTITLNAPRIVECEDGFILDLLTVPGYCPVRLDLAEDVVQPEIRQVSGGQWKAIFSKTSWTTDDLKSLGSLKLQLQKQPEPMKTTLVGQALLDANPWRNEMKLDFTNWPELGQVLAGSKDNPTVLINNIMDLIGRDAIYDIDCAEQYEGKGLADIAQTVIDQRMGGCREFALLGYAVLMQAGVPVQILTGHRVKNGEFSEKGHTILEFMPEDGESKLFDVTPRKSIGDISQYGWSSTRYDRFHSPQFLRNKHFIVKVLHHLKNYHYQLLSQLDDKMFEDPDIARIALQKEYKKMSELPKSLLGNKAFVLACIQDEEIRSYELKLTDLSEELQRDRDIIIATIENNSYDNYPLAPQWFKEDRDAILRLLKDYKIEFYNIEPQFKTQPEFYEASLSNAWDFFRNVPKEKQADEAYVKKHLLTLPRPYECLDEFVDNIGEELQNDVEFMKYAIVWEPDLAEFVKPEILEKLKRRGLLPEE